MLSIPRLVIAGTASGTGKTTFVTGLISALRLRGLRVQPFKCGPDYIDPGYHTQAAGRSSRNLDTWMLTEAQMLQSFERACRGADIAIIEGVMGLFDGSDFQTERASAAHIAKLLKAPVVLLLDISGAARSSAATALGFKVFDPELPLAGFVLNFAGSQKHAEGCRSAIERVCQLPVPGWLPKVPHLAIPERHLGLQLAQEAPVEALIGRLGDLVATQVNIDALCKIAATAAPLSLPGKTPVGRSRPGARPRLAVARDQAFCFHYQDNLEHLENEGVELVYFRPADGEPMPGRVSGVYLGGGYPELHAAKLSANQPFLRGLAQMHSQGNPIFAECGGFMALTEAILDSEGNSWPMAGLVPGTTRMLPRLASLGYRRALVLRDNLLAEAGSVLKGHEFHYSIWEGPESASEKSAWELQTGLPGERGSPAGFSEGNLLASYLHIHFAQAPSIAKRFADVLGQARVQN